MELTADQVAELQAATTPRGQLLTSKHKQPVYIPSNTESSLYGYVWKGPFAPDNPRLIMTRWRTECFALMESLVVAPQFVSDYAGQVWMRFPNIGLAAPSEWITEMRMDKCEGREVCIVNRESMGAGQLINENLETIKDHMFGEARCLLLSYIDAAVLGTGDMGMWNCIVNSEGESFIIDYSDNSHRGGITTWLGGIFAKPSGTLTEDMFGEEMTWIDTRVLEHLNSIALLVPQFITAAKKHGADRIFAKYKLNWQPHRIINDFRALVGPRVDND